MFVVVGKWQNMNYNQQLVLNKTRVKTTYNELKNWLPEFEAILGSEKVFQ
jgi:hypothetical protein